MTDNTMHRGFSVIYRHGRIMNDRAMKHFSLTGQQMGYLRYINENPGTSQEELAKFMQIDKGAVAKAIKEIEKKGYITKEQNTLDKRAYRLFPTEKAEEMAKCGKRHSEEFEKQLTKGMTDEEVEQFKILLAKITENMMRIIEGNEII